MIFIDLLQISEVFICIVGHVSQCKKYCSYNAQLQLLCDHETQTNVNIVKLKWVRQSPVHICVVLAWQRHTEICVRVCGTQLLILLALCSHGWSRGFVVTMRLSKHPLGGEVKHAVMLRAFYIEVREQLRQKREQGCHLEKNIKL